MRFIANGSVFLVSVLHFLFLGLEMFLWTQPLGLQIFGMTQEYANDTSTLAANQGLYNGFLAVGLLWAVFADRLDLKTFFLGCVMIAGVFGAATASSTILYVQALPALIAFILTLLFAQKKA